MVADDGNDYGKLYFSKTAASVFLERGWLSLCSYNGTDTPSVRRWACVPPFNLDRGLDYSDSQGAAALTRCDVGPGHGRIQLPGSVLSRFLPLELSCHIVRKPKLAHVMRPQERH